MAIDQVHDLQFVFREILHTMSRPGQIQSLENLAGKNEFDLPMFDATLFTIMTLFDAEVSFHVLPASEHQVIEKVAGYTLATHTTVEEADFIIALRHAKEAEIIEAMEACKEGTLIDPHSAATWVVETAFSDQLVPVNLTGPGIKEQTTLHALSSKIWEARNTKNSEFPLGNDLILTDENLQIACVPRTTQAEMIEVK